jgi:hypothetical protein
LPHTHAVAARKPVHEQVSMPCGRQPGRSVDRSAAVPQPNLLASVDVQSRERREDANAPSAALFWPQERVRGGPTAIYGEEVPSEAYLALALINVVRKKGALGIDGQTVEEADADAPKLLPHLRRALLGRGYRVKAASLGLSYPGRRRPWRRGVLDPLRWV